VAGTTFAEGLVYFHGKWFLYYGCADSLVGVVTAPNAAVLRVCGAIELDGDDGDVVDLAEDAGGLGDDRGGLAAKVAGAVEAEQFVFVAWDLDCASTTPSETKVRRSAGLELDGVYSYSTLGRMPSGSAPTRSISSPFK